MPNHPKKPKSAKSGCWIAGTVVVVAAMLGIAGIVYLANQASSDFDSRREKMCLRPGLVVTGEHLRFAPGIDAAMWSKFTVRAKSLDEVFDTTKVDTSAFDRDGYKFKVDGISDAWWDADKRHLIGGEDDVGDDFMRVGYVDNGDGTLTLYIYWFAV